MENSKISWTDHTFNPWSGCTKVSAGCANCYAEALMDKRFGEVQWGTAGTRKRTSPANWRKPLAWNKQAWTECSFCGWRGDYLSCPNCDSLDLRPARQRVFCASLGDVFEDRSELVEWRRDLVVMMEQTPNLDWLLLTKRPENVTRMIAEAITIDPDTWWMGMRNVWIGTSVENQKTADERIPHLLKVPAAVRFLSMEPLLGPVDLGPALYINGVHKREIYYQRIQWIIVGGESGPNARPMHPDWVRSIRDQCQTAGVPFHFKQWGEWLPMNPDCDGNGVMYNNKPERGVGSGSGLSVADGYPASGYPVRKVGKKAAGRLLDGREWNEYPKGQR